MSTASPLPSPPFRRATVEEWLAVSEAQRAELIHDTIVHHASPGPEHGFSQGGVFVQLWPYNRRGGGSDETPGGWWISQEVDMVIGGIGCRPDVVGWRRDRHAQAPGPDSRGVVTSVPDFICEVLSPSTARYDQGAKRDAYFQARVSHYWLVDPSYRTLTVLERTDRGYVIVLVAGPGEAVRAPPFDRFQIQVGDLFIEDDSVVDPAGEPAGALPLAHPPALPDKG